MRAEDRDDGEGPLMDGRKDGTAMRKVPGNRGLRHGCKGYGSVVLRSFPAGMQGLLTN